MNQTKLRKPNKLKWNFQRKFYLTHYMLVKLKLGKDDFISIIEGHLYLKLHQELFQLFILLLNLLNLATMQEKETRK